MPEELLHAGAIKIRVVGQGVLVPTLYSLNKVNQMTTAFVTMQSPNPNEPLILTNFVSHRIMLRLETNHLNDQFRINRIILYVKPIYTSLPG